jgi:hypothetical protein
MPKQDVARAAIARDEPLVSLVLQGSATAPGDGGEALVGQTPSSGVRLSNCFF